MPGERTQFFRVQRKYFPFEVNLARMTLTPPFVQAALGVIRPPVLPFLPTVRVPDELAIEEALGIGFGQWSGQRRLEFLLGIRAPVPRRGLRQFGEKVYNISNKLISSDTGTLNIVLLTLHRPFVLFVS